MARDLHDGLGGSMVRPMAVVEQTAQPLPGERVLSLVKVLRDELRQVIDQGSSSGDAVPKTPPALAGPVAPPIQVAVDTMQVTSEWPFPTHWEMLPIAAQYLGLTRLVEEALSNVIKHSQATEARVYCSRTP